MAKSKKKPVKKASSAKKSKSAVAKKAAPAKKAATRKAAAPAKKMKTKKAAPIKKAAQKIAPAKKMAAPKATPSSQKNFKWSDVVTPLDDRLIVIVKSEERRTPGGLYIPDTVESNAAHLQGEVVSVGRGHLDGKGKVRPLDVQKGNQVLFASYTGNKIEFQGQSAYILRESEVVGILT